jgi:hypothetical protein
MGFTHKKILPLILISDQFFGWNLSGHLLEIHQNGTGLFNKINNIESIIDKNKNIY